jgi:hypothetical protein
MHVSSPEQVTDLLLEWRGGNAGALDRLIPLVYDELRRVAQRCLRNERAGNTMQTTGLVNEAYLRLVARAACTGATARISSPSPRS